MLTYRSMSSEKYCLYIHEFPNGKVYIGITKQDPERRWQKGHGYKDTVVGLAIMKYGWENVKSKVLVEGMSKRLAEKTEIRLIK